MDDKTKKKKRDTLGWSLFAVWFVLIWVGIYHKRVLGHPDRMVFFHLPAAVCLVVACYRLSAPFRRRHKEVMAKFLKSEYSS